jgi:hypothetical protein
MIGIIEGDARFAVAEKTRLLIHAGNRQLETSDA